MREGSSRGEAVAERELHYGLHCSSKAGESRTRAEEGTAVKREKSTARGSARGRARVKSRARDRAELGAETKADIEQNYSKDRAEKSAERDHI